MTTQCAPHRQTGQLLGRAEADHRYSYQNLVFIGPGAKWDVGRNGHEPCVILFLQDGVPGVQNIRYFGTFILRCIKEWICSERTITL